MEQLVEEQDGIHPDLNAHGTEEKLELYALGRLPDSDRALLEEHLIVCAVCREKLDGIGGFALAMREAGKQQPEAASTRKLASFFRQPAVSMALVFVLVVIVIAIFSTERTEVAPSAALQLTAARGGMPSTVSARQLDLRLADPPAEGGPFRVAVFNAAGGTVWSGLAESTPAGVDVSVTVTLPQGDYFVRLYSVDGKTLREYGFRVRG